MTPVLQTMGGIEELSKLFKLTQKENNGVRIQTHSLTPETEWTQKSAVTSYTMELLGIDGYKSNFCK